MTTLTERQKATRHILDRSKDIFRVAKHNLKETKSVGVLALESKKLSTTERLKLIASGEATLNPDRLLDNGQPVPVTEAFDCPGDVEQRAALEALEAQYELRMAELENAYFEIRDRANLMTGEVEHEKTVQMFEKFKADYYVPVGDRGKGYGAANYQE